jgi:hypothetical protein
MRLVLHGIEHYVDGGLAETVEVARPWQVLRLMNAYGAVHGGSFFSNVTQPKPFGV